MNVLEKGKRIILDFPENLKMDGVLTEYYPSQMIIEPIIFNGVNTGVLLLASSSTLQSEFIEHLDIFIKSLAVVLNNALQHERMQLLAAL